MTLLQQVVVFFESLFKSSNPEVQKKIQIRNIENTFKNSSTNIYKFGLLQPSFAQAMYLLQKHTRALAPYISSITDNTDNQYKEKIYIALIETGYNESIFSDVKLFSYTEKKERMKLAKSSMTEVESQRQNLEEYLKYLQKKPFFMIQQTLQNLDLFINVCTFNYISCIHLFDPSYEIGQSESPSLKPIPIDKAETILQDFYFITKNLKINVALVRAIFAIVRILKPKEATAKTQDDILSHIKTISAILHQILTPENLTLLLKLAKNDISFIPQAMTSNINYLAKYKTKIKRKFEAEEKRISTELQDETLSATIKKLFGETSLIPVKGYNQDLNQFLQENTSASFLWITPLEIIKNFLSVFFTEKVTALLNDIVVEGFFIDPMYKSNFSSLVYTCSEFPNKMKEFENDFSDAGANSLSLIRGYVKDSQKDIEFDKTLQSLIDKINLKAKDLVQTIGNNLAQLHINIERILSDSKKSSPEEIENIKILIHSSRNYDRTEFLEKSRQKWKLFIDIMKNYAIINNEV